MVHNEEEEEEQEGGEEKEEGGGGDEEEEEEGEEEESRAEQSRAGARSRLAGTRSHDHRRGGREISAATVTSHPRLRDDKGG